MKCFEKHLAKVHRTLAEARPTAVDPVNAMRWMLENMTGTTVAKRQEQALILAEQFADDDAAHCQALGQAGERVLLRPYIQPQIGLAGFLVRPVTLETMPGQYRPNVALKIRRRLGSQLGGKQDEQPRMFQQCTTASHDVG